MAEVGGKCYPCDISCESCESYNLSQCITCGDNRYTTDTTPIACVLTCPNEYYAEASKVCKKCHAACSKCEGGNTDDKCTECAYGYDFNADSPGRCTSCPSGSAYSPTESKCLPCHFACDACTLPDSNAHCTACAPGLAQNGTTCLAACPDGYFLSPPSCLPCAPSCSTCKGSSTSCLECATGKGSQFLKVLPKESDKKFETVPGTCVSSCPEGLYVDPSKTACVTSCPNGSLLRSSECLPCDPSCIGCLLAEDAFGCTVCRRYLRVDVSYFNKSLSEANGGVLYGQCVDLCNPKDLKDANNTICYAYKDRGEQYRRQIEFTRGRMSGIISDSLM
eukprot:TRINITY_DN9058_c0_g2_i1.p1 TRINITY_DN9058_c0_g2~~TRINITY_DN9058_c0_g2_i1.p1  ORF type:complete len:335 (-),score=13.90 TRINITY_DN9058_c0_g2_i1:420-1424(-)